MADLDLIDVSPLARRPRRATRRRPRHRPPDRPGVPRRSGSSGSTGHGIPADLFERLRPRQRPAFFELPERAKRPRSRWTRAGAAWRGLVPRPRRDHLRTTRPQGRPVRRRVDHPADHPRVRAGTPLHGANLFPAGRSRTRPSLGWLDALRPLADALMRAIAVGARPARRLVRAAPDRRPDAAVPDLPLPGACPTTTRRTSGASGEHTDYGLLTLLARTTVGGLEVRTPDGSWLDVPAEPGVLVCNIGDMLDRLTEGRYRSTPHRVRNTSGRSRLSFPYFFDPSWDAEVIALPLDGTPPADDADRRWDGASLHAWTGTYGDYLTSQGGQGVPRPVRSVR